MNDDRLNDLIIKFTAELSSLNANMKSVLEKLSVHEQRISNLENSKSSIKDDIVKWLVRALICSLAIIGSLTGSSALIGKLLGL